MAREHGGTQARQPVCSLRQLVFPICIRIAHGERNALRPPGQITGLVVAPSHMARAMRDTGCALHPRRSTGREGADARGGDR